jgi:Chaperone of endosialidase
MKPNFSLGIARGVIAAALVIAAVPAFAQSTVFTYQGRLDQGGTPATGLHDLRFRLFNAVVEGSQIGATICTDDVSVTDGLFTVNLDFGAQFISTGQRFLEVDVRSDTGDNCNNATGFTLLGPRQLITTVPSATHANSAYRLDAADGSPANVVTVDDFGATRVGGALIALGAISTISNLNVSGDAFVSGDAGVTNFLGIGTGFPERKLHIRAEDPVVILQDTDSNSFQSGYIGFWNSTPTEVGWIGYGTPGDPDISIVNARPGGDIILNPLGGASALVGIAVDEPLFLLHVAGSAGKPGGGSWSSASDGRLKKNIAPLAGALEQMLALRGVTYEYLDPTTIHELPGEQMGMIAQEVEAVFPAWVDEGPNGYKRLTFRGFEALTVEALREIKSKADADALTLRTEVAVLRQENTELRRRLDAVEAALARLGR